MQNFEPRKYQLEAAQSVLSKGNTLVVMPTALGKTHIAILVLAELLKKNPKTRVIFLAPTKPLAAQQLKKLKECLSLLEESFCLLTGEISPLKRTEFLKTAQIIVATPQAIENDVLAGRMHLKDFNFIVFDEVHRAVGEYSYSFIAQQAVKATPSPLILGLTASPSSQKEKIKEICSNLNVKNVFVRSESDADVIQYIQPVRVEWEFISLPEEIKEMRVNLTEVLRDSIRELKELGFLQSADLALINKKDILALRGAISRHLSNNPSAFRAMTLQAKAMSIMHALDILDSQGLSALHAFVLSIFNRQKPSKAAKQLASDFRLKKTLVNAENLLKQGVDHPKFGVLTKMVLHAVSEGQSVIVFAHFRDAVEKIVKLLTESNVSCAALVGRAIKNGSGMTQKKQLEIVEKFKNREFKVLVCTSVGEEGLDLTTVDLVIFFEAVPSEIRLIQRRGRAGRTKKGKVIVLVARGTKDEAFHWISRSKEKKMKQTLKNLPQLTMGDFDER